MENESMFIMFYISWYLPIISIGASLKSVVYKSYVCLEYILVFQEIVVLVLFMSQKKILLLCNDDKAPSTYSDY